MAAFTAQYQSPQMGWRGRHELRGREVLTWTLPYEIIVVGVYDE